MKIAITPLTMIWWYAVQKSWNYLWELDVIACRIIVRWKWWCGFPFIRIPRCLVIWFRRIHHNFTNSHTHTSQTRDTWNTHTRIKTRHKLYSERGTVLNICKITSKRDRTNNNFATAVWLGTKTKRPNAAIRMRYLLTKLRRFGGRTTTQGNSGQTHVITNLNRCFWNERNNMSAAPNRHFRIMNSWFCCQHIFFPLTYFMTLPN